MIVCALFCLTALTAASPPAQAQDTSADRFTNRDLLEQSDRDQRLWIFGVIVGASHGLGLRDTSAGECLARWYFDDEEQVYANIRVNLERYPDNEPTIIILALARRACPNLDAQ